MLAPLHRAILFLKQATSIPLTTTALFLLQLEAQHDLELQYLPQAFAELVVVLHR